MFEFHDTSSGRDECFGTARCGDTACVRLCKDKNDGVDDPELVKAPKLAYMKRLKFGFIVGGSDAEPKAKCIKCSEFLSQPDSFKKLCSFFPLLRSLPMLWKVVLRNDLTLLPNLP